MRPAVKFAHNILAAPNDKLLAKLSAFDEFKFMGKTYHFVSASQSEQSLDNYLVGNHRNESIYGLAGNDTLEGGGGNDNLYGDLGDDKLYGNGDDYLYGGAGDDTLFSQGNWQHNSLTGGAGDDLLMTDRYVKSSIYYAVGDGADIIRRNNPYHQYDSVYQDKVIFGDGIAFADLSLSKQGSHLYIQVGDDTHDSLLIENFYAVDGRLRTKVNQFEFTDGTVIKRENIQSGSDDNDALVANGDLSYLHSGNGQDSYEVDFTQTQKTVVDNYDNLSSELRFIKHSTFSAPQ